MIEEKIVKGMIAALVVFFLYGFYKVTEPKPIPVPVHPKLLALGSCYIELCRQDVVCRYQIVGVNHVKYILKYKESKQSGKVLTQYLTDMSVDGFNHKVKYYSGASQCEY